MLSQQTWVEYVVILTYSQRENMLTKFSAESTFYEMFAQLNCFFRGTLKNSVAVWEIIDVFCLQFGLLKLYRGLQNNFVNRSLAL